MNALGSCFYDPTGGAAVSKATTALLAMTALDTTNLRVTFTGPLSGRVKVVISGGALHGAATYPFILLGILASTTVIARVVPNVTICGAASATTPASLYAEFVVSVTPGASNTWDLAYGVEGLIAATGLKYGGPNNNTTAGDAFGGIGFSVWDASPTYLPAAMPTTSMQAQSVANGSALTTIATYIDTEVAAIKAKTDQLTFTIANKVDSSIQAAGDFAQGAADKVWSTAARSLTTFGTLAADVWAVATRVLTAGTNIALAKGTGVTGFNDLSAAQVNAEADTALADVGLTGTITGRIDAAISTRSTYAGADTSGTTTLLSRLTSGRATLLDNLDILMTTRLASASYTTPPTAAANATAVRSELTTELGRIDAATSTRLATAGYTAPDNASITAIKGVVDKLDTAMEIDGAVYRFTTNALEQAPSGGGGGGAGLTQADVRTAIGLGSANLDTQLAAISGKVDAVDDLLDTEVAVIKTDTAAIKTQTDGLNFTGDNLQVTLEAVRGNALTGSGAGPYGT
jgi:hypothetical protein